MSLRSSSLSPQLGFTRAASCLGLALAGFVSFGGSKGWGGLQPVMAVDKHKFRTCGDTGFCRRNRGKASPSVPFRVDVSSVHVDTSQGVTADVIPSDGGEALHLSVGCLTSGVCRLRITEKHPKNVRWEAPEVLMEENMVLTSHEEVPPGDASLPEGLRGIAVGEGVHIKYGEGLLISVTFNPFAAHLYVNGEEAVSANTKGSLYFEQQRERGEGFRKAKEAGASQGQAAGEGQGQAYEVPDQHQGKEVVDYGEDGLAIYADGSRQSKEDHETWKRQVEEVAKGQQAQQVQAEAAADGSSSSSGGVSEDDDPDKSLGLWEESFGGHPDSKPRGPMSVGVDVHFPDAKHTYGLPEHSTSLALPSTTGPGARYSEPYRLYTLDVFEYILDSPMALYGNIPLVLSHKLGQTTGVFWNNPSETFVDVSQESQPDGDGAAVGDTAAGAGSTVFWMSESGVIDLMLIPGPSPKKVLDQYTRLTGRPELPPLFSLGYHQCRWNYKDMEDVRTVDQGFEDLDMPYDVIWLDIEHTDGKRYFSWDKDKFSEPEAMQDRIAAHGRKMVTIVDPHIKRDSRWDLHKEATKKGLYIKDKDGNDFDGWCWPGSSSYLDFTDSTVRQWWADRFSLSNYKGSTLNLHVWNDMNEPSVFNGPEVSMKKDCLSIQGVEHREWHNLYGMYMQRATSEGLVQRHPDQNARSFVLSRSFWAGSQRWGAIWTGDNTADWAHLEASGKMLMSMGIAGLPFVGADVGGFFGNPDAELFLRWMQAGALQPFFRSHAHLDSKRREPWVFGEPWTARIREAVVQRYVLLPYWYTLFQEASTSGVPMMRPMWMEFPDDPTTFDMDDQWMVGSALLVKPVTAQGQDSLDLYLPSSSPSSPDVWYHMHTHERFAGGDEKGGRRIELSAAIDAPLPVLQRGGTVIPTKGRLRRSSKLMSKDPYTLVVALSSAGTAEGRLYMDDEESFDYRLKGQSSLRLLRFEDGALSCSTAGGAGNSIDNGSAAAAGGVGDTPGSSEEVFANPVERVVVVGVESVPEAVVLERSGLEQQQQQQQQQQLSFVYDKDKRLLVVKKPGVRAAEDWVLRLLDHEQAAALAVAQQKQGDGKGPQGPQGPQGGGEDAVVE